ncbi:MAG: 4Fe-4S binding protein [Candidatus Rokubacteria bacterium]|nr:4Fe-4S binding protein [Candidatus Rokubacteria bacterium]
MKRRVAALAGVLLALGVASVALAGFVHPRGGRDVEVRLMAGKFAFDPPRLTVEAGDRVTFRIRSRDVTHGFAVEGTGIETTVLPGREARVTVPAAHAGKLRYRCSVVCGPLHPFMVGEIVVRPNPWPLGAGALALAVGFLASAGGLAATRRWDLTRSRALRWLLAWRPLQFALVAPNLAVFTLIVVAGLAGTSTGATNFSTIFVWLVWWGLLVLVLIPLGGRLWCAMCPLPAPAEWIARGAIVEHRVRGFGLGRAWPKALQNIWPAFGALFLLVLFGIVITTRPLVTALLLAGFAVAALGIHLVFDRRAFCRYVCPVGALVGVYANVSPLELRARDLDVCRRCREKACFRGGDAYPCPTFQFPGGGLQRNTYCLLCTECVKACPYDNVAVRVRSFAADLGVSRGRRMDEAWLTLLLLGTALAHSVVKLGPWGTVKSWANFERPTDFALYSALFAGVTLVALPALHLGTAWLSRALARTPGFKLSRLFVDYAYALLPVSLGAWMAFTLAVVAPNLSYVPRVLSDPLGWGWDLFGTRETTWTWMPVAALPWLQLGLVLAGLWGSVRAARAIVAEVIAEPRARRRALLPLTLLLVAIAWAFVTLYFG